MSVVSQLVRASVATGTVGSLFADHNLPQRTAAWLDQSVHCGAGQRRSVAITFDDGPSRGTPALLEYLREEEVRATFFQLGMHVERLPAIARQVSADGHEIANHGWSHVSLRPHSKPSLHFPTPALMYRELTQTQRMLEQVHGRVTDLFRPPFGFSWVGLAAVQRYVGLRTVQWTVLGHDWEWTAARVAAHVLSQIKPGAIICLHDGRDIAPNPDIRETVDALRLIIPALRRQGYSFETVSDLLRSDAAARPIRHQAPAFQRGIASKGRRAPSYSQNT